MQLFTQDEKNRCQQCDKTKHFPKLSLHLTAAHLLEGPSPGPQAGTLAPHLPRVSLPSWREITKLRERPRSPSAVGEGALCTQPRSPGLPAGRARANRERLLRRVQTALQPRNKRVKKPGQQQTDGPMKAIRKHSPPSPPLEKYSRLHHGRSRQPYQSPMMMCHKSHKRHRQNLLPSKVCSSKVKCGTHRTSGKGAPGHLLRGALWRALEVPLQRTASALGRARARAAGSESLDTFPAIA